MVEWVVLGAFAIGMVAGTIAGVPLWALLLGGLALFVGHGVLSGVRLSELARLCARSVRDVTGVLLLLALVGMLTGVWRASGTIPAIASLCGSVLGPWTILPVTFVACAGMSVLTGSNFASAATVGVVCMSLGREMGTSELILGGAILSGSSVGTQLSQLSGAANVVAMLTHTSAGANLGRTARSVALPAAIALAAYAVLGLAFGGTAAESSLAATYVAHFDLSWYVLLPVAVMVVLSIVRAPALWTMAGSVLAACVLCVAVQGMTAGDTLLALVAGFHPADAGLAAIAEGGGLVSMASVLAVVGIASTYAGVLERTGLLSGVRDLAARLARRTNPYTATLATSLAMCGLASDLMVETMLTRQVCQGLGQTDEELALDLANSSLVVPTLIPWSTSLVGTVAFVGMPTASILAAFYCWAVPAVNLVRAAGTPKAPRMEGLGTEATALVAQIGA